MSDHTKVGELRSGNEPRDAIHIAVAPVVATVTMNPGTHIGFCGEGAEEVAPCEVAMSVGIVDPFLQKTVRPGDRIWMFLHPNTITSLRHNWTHPAFGHESEDNSVNKEASEKWLRTFLASDGPDYDLLIKAMQNGGEYEAGYHSIFIDNERINVGGQDAHGDIPPQFWDHVEIVLGRKVPWRSDHFSCSC